MVALAGVLVTIVAAGRAAAAGAPWATGVREIIILALTATAYGATSQEHRERNAFSFGPIIEVAVVFAAIFVTMAPVLELLNAWSQGARTVLGMRFGVAHPWEFFWTTGALSSVLDNAPTYLTFAASAAGLSGIPPHGPYVGALVLQPDTARILAAISTGSVYMGALPTSATPRTSRSEPSPRRAASRCRRSSDTWPTAAGFCCRSSSR